jgi:hypothetical protein
MPSRQKIRFSLKCLKIPDKPTLFISQSCQKEKTLKLTEGKRNHDKNISNPVLKVKEANNKSATSVEAARGRERPLQDALSEDTLVEKRDRIGKMLRAGSLQAPGTAGNRYSNYKEYIKAAHQSMPEPAVMH